VDTAALEAAAAAAVAVSLGSALPLPLPVPSVSAEPYVEDDRRVRVSVYYYLKAQRKNRRKYIIKLLGLNVNQIISMSKRKYIAQIIIK
jgi:hypothetical protein